MPPSEKELLISSADINRPGLQLVGFFDYFDNQRIQLIGKSEMGYISQLTPEQEEAVMEKFMAAKPVAVIQSRGNQPSEIMLEKARKYSVPVLVTPGATTSFSAALTAFLNIELAPRITRHGVLMEVYGEGILLVGDSGVGKSEAAIELIKRGHRLIADDAVEIRRVSNISLVGQAPENIRHFSELRGIGLINAQRIFGTGAVKPSQKIELAIKLETWDATKIYDRMGIDNEYTEILGIRVPVMTIPVKPGRNLAVIIEVAAMNNRQKKMGYNAAHELLSNMGMDMEDMGEKDVQIDLDI